MPKPHRPSSPSVKRPPPLCPGAKISVVAPSGPFDDDVLRAGLSQLGRYQLSVPDDLWGRRDGFFAGGFDRRLQELQAALDDPSCAAILLARGGYGIAPLLPHLDWSGFDRASKWFVGFSDGTALHAELSAKGLMTLHAANATTLARATPDELEEVIAVLEGRDLQTFSELDVLSPGTAEGTLFGGNLTVLFAEAAAGRLRIPSGAVLFLEDVTETSYRVDRMLTSLFAGGHLSHLSGVLLGEFLDCSPGKFDVPTQDVLCRNLGALNIPVFSGVPSGHGACNRPLLLGASARMSSDDRRLDLRG